MVYHRSEGGGSGRPPRSHRHSREDDRCHSSRGQTGSRSSDSEDYHPPWDHNSPRSSGIRIPDRFIPPPPPPMFGSHAFRYQDAGQFNQQVAQFTPDTYPHYGAEPEPQKPTEDKSKQNVFQNDGSFLEMFKKMQDSKPPAPAATVTKVETPVASVSKVEDTTVVNKKLTSLPMVGKRRGGRVLKTGLVKKLKLEKPEDKEPKNAWSMYMNEVRKYKEASCEEEGKTRPLVK